MNLTSILNNKVEIYSIEKIKNEIGAMEQKATLLKKCYCNIIPAGNGTKNTVANTEYNAHSHKFKFRYNSIKDIKKDWYFIFENRKYDVVSWDIDFKNREYIDVITTLVQE